jgi:hypothetical protein
MQEVKKKARMTRAKVMRFFIVCTLEAKIFGIDNATVSILLL